MSERRGNDADRGPLEARSIPAAELRRTLSETLSEVAFLEREVIVTRNGKPVAALIPVSQYDRLRPSAPRVQVSEEARQGLERAPDAVRPLLLERIAELERDPEPTDRRALRSGAFRLSVGDYRLIYSRRLDATRVERIGPRDELYREL